MGDRPNLWYVLRDAAAEWHEETGQPIFVMVYTGKWIPGPRNLGPVMVAFARLGPNMVFTCPCPYADLPWAVNPMALEEAKERNSLALQPERHIMIAAERLIRAWDAEGEDAKRQLSESLRDAFANLIDVFNRAVEAQV